MGSNTSKRILQSFELQAPSRNHFEFLHVIGKGGFGKVWKIMHKQTSHHFAVKSMSKVKIIDCRSEKSILMEKDFLTKLHHPFLVNMICTFQDKDSLYLVMDYLSGGDLRYHLGINECFTEAQTKFFIGCLLIALEYIHSQGVIHRDVKPENIISDNDGYIHLTDFGIARNINEEQIDTSGTSGYIAPEVLFAKKHSCPVDFFALGVIAFEFMTGLRPYRGRNRKEIMDKIVAYQINITEDKLKEGWSMNAADFINKLLIRKPAKRLGTEDIGEIKQHPWLSDIDWDSLGKKEIKSPFMPPSSDNIDKSFCEYTEERSEETQGRYQQYVHHEGFDDLFKGYSCVNKNVKQEILHKPEPLPDVIHKERRKISMVSLQHLTFKNSTIQQEKGQPQQVQSLAQPKLSKVYSTRCIHVSNTKQKSRNLLFNKNDKTLSYNRSGCVLKNLVLPIAPGTINQIQYRPKLKKYASKDKDKSIDRDNYKDQAKSKIILRLRNKSKLPPIDLSDCCSHNRQPRTNRKVIPIPQNIRLIEFEQINTIECLSTRRGSHNKSIKE